MAAAEYFEDEVVLDADDLEKLFQAATEFVRTMKNLSDEKRLTFYALFKQVCFLIIFCTLFCTEMRRSCKLKLKLKFGSKDFVFNFAPK